MFRGHAEQILLGQDQLVLILHGGKLRVILVALSLPVKSKILRGDRRQPASRFRGAHRTHDACAKTSAASAPTIFTSAFLSPVDNAKMSCFFSQHVLDHTQGYPPRLIEAAYVQLIDIIDRRMHRSAGPAHHDQRERVKAALRKRNVIEQRADKTKSLQG